VTKIYIEVVEDVQADGPVLVLEVLDHQQADLLEDRIAERSLQEV